MLPQNEWYIDGIRVDFVEMDQPIRTRGQDVSLQCLILPGEAPSVRGFVLGGTDGTTLGGPSGGILGGEPSLEAADRYRKLRQYGEFAGEVSVSLLQGGIPTVREHPEPEWPVESHVVPVRPGHEVYHTPGFWGAITGYSDGTVVLGERNEDVVFRLTFDFVFLADLDAYETRDELLDDLSPEINQL